jgi:3-isopropylmalate/(R)-2-methylmalate dehydratase small subunit
VEKFTTHAGKVVPLYRTNVDTDQIIPAVHLKRIERTGWGQFMFERWRSDPSFVLNRSEYADGSVLVAGDNFGCGSSREHAPWALLDYGIRAVLCSEIADIFRGNALKNGLLAIVIDELEHRWLLKHPGIELAIDVREQYIALPDGGRIPFRLEPFARHCLLNGVDQLGYLLQHADAITHYEQQEQAA